MWRDCRFVLSLMCLCVLPATIFSQVKLARGPDSGDSHYSSPISYAAFSDDSELLATSAGWKITIWKVNEERQLREIRLETSVGPIIGIAFSHDGTILMGGGMDGKIREWNVGTGKEAKVLNAVEEGVSTGSAASIIDAVAFSHNGKLFAKGNHSGTVTLWDLRDGKRTATISGSMNQIKALAFSPDDLSLVVGDSDGNIIVWNSKEHGAPEIFTQRTADERRGWIYALAFSNDGKMLATSGFHPGVILWDVKSAEQVAVVGPDYDWVESIAISPDSKLLATGGKNGADRDPDTHIPRSHKVSIWELKSKTQVKTARGRAPAFSPNGQLVAICEEQKVSFIKLAP